MVTILLNGVTMYQYYQSYLYSRFPLQKAIVYSCGWLITAQVIIIRGEAWRASWWLYHFLLLGSMLVMLAGLYRQYASRQSLSGAVRALFTNDPIERVTNSISPSVQTLMASTEQRDPYTAGHNFRVTLYALKLAEELQLRPDELRALAQGTIVHDIGKMDIPDSILNKPGRLSPSERAIIETHPVIGYERCRRLGFLPEELGIIRSHHEKWNGGGYPDRLTGEEIPLMARIVAVADVYDALTSRRAYRQAMPHEEAMAFLEANRGVILTRRAWMPGSGCAGGIRPFTNTPLRCSGSGCRVRFSREPARHGKGTGKAIEPCQPAGLLADWRKSPISS
ncbi:HD-GYP domain-containing protein [Paenibacillus sp. CC-CFT747]|nr:HD-GYP domain-containing protein [Paenibacillus sp. CC-CFT747]